MSVISIAIQKGGSGKTTTAVNLAAGLMGLNRSVLLLDADPQCNLTQSLGVRTDMENNLYTEFRKEMTGRKSDLQQAIVATATGLDLVPASLDLVMTEQELVGKFNREQTLRNKMLKPLIGQYDFIIIDCPPSFGLLTVNALAASDYLVIPLQAEFLPLQGVRSFFELLESMKDIPGLKLEIAGFLFTQYNHRKRLSREIRMQLERDFDVPIFRTSIRTDVSLPLSQKSGQDVFTSAPASHAAEDYASLAREVLERTEANLVASSASWELTEMAL